MAASAKAGFRNARPKTVRQMTIEEEKSGEYFRYSLAETFLKLSLLAQKFQKFKPDLKPNNYFL